MINPSNAKRFLRRVSLNLSLPRWFTTSPPFKRFVALALTVLDLGLWVNCENTDDFDEQGIGYSVRLGGVDYAKTLARGWVADE
jgi:hypothetical protein